ncbi:MAG TPA: GNAT family N-acetyltransferase [Gaiellaceae bacterium]
MLVRRCRDVDEFLARAGEFLAAREAEHNLILGLSSSLRRQSRMYGEDPYLAVVEADSQVVAAALRTPPHNLVLSEIDDQDAIEPLVVDVHDVFEALPGLLAPSDVAARFARAWEAATGVGGHRVLAERAFRAERVVPPRRVAGRMRPYRSSDRELAVRWLDAFTAEALPEPPPEPSDRWLDRRLAEPEGSVVLWEDGEPVSLAAAGGPTPNGIRIGPVYTPPELRGRGYASALVAELTRVQLEGGRRFCFLFTDLANPTSNRIYQRVGYEPVTDVDQWSFA